MTVTQQTTRFAFTANGATTIFAYACRVLQTADMAVYLNGALQVSGYSVTGIGVDSGGTVVFAVAPANGVIVVLQRLMVVDRQTDYQYGGPFNESTVDLDQDRQTMLIQQVNANLARAIQIPDGETTTTTLAAAAARANKYLVFDALGNVSVSTGTGADAGLRADLANTANPALGVHLIGGAARILDFTSAQFGGIGDGVTDNFTALKNAINYCKISGHKLWIPAGNYLINTAGGTIDIERVCIEGEGIYSDGAPYAAIGSVFSIIGTVNSPFNLKHSFAFIGVTFFYPNITDTNPPLLHPPLFKGTWIARGYFDNVSVINAYDFIACNIGVGSMGDVRFNDCRVFALRYTFNFQNGAAEVIQMTNCLFTYGLYEDVVVPGIYLLPFYTTNGEFIHCDTSGGFAAVSILFSNVVYFGGRYGIRILSGNFGIEGASNLAFDAVGTMLSIEGTGNLTNNPFSNVLGYCYKIGDASANAPAIYAHGAASQLTFTGFQIGYSQGHGIDIGDGNIGNNLDITGGRIGSWGQTTGGAAEYYGIAINDASLTANIRTSFYASAAGGNTFTGVGVTNCNKVDISGCDFHNCNLSIRVSGGNRVNIRDCSSTGTNTKDINYSTASGVVRASNNDWSTPGATIAFPSFRVAKAASQTFNSGTATTAVWGTETYDLDTNFTTNTFTVPQTGKYHFSCALMHDTTGTAGDRWLLIIAKNGTIVSSVSYKIIADYNSVLISDTIQCTAADTVDIRVQRAGGAGVFATFNDGSANYFSGELIQPS